jgi:hypothetical protein
MDRVTRAALIAVTLGLASTPAGANEPIVLAVVDLDDDDGNGVPDLRQMQGVPPADLVALPAMPAAGQRVVPSEGFRLLVGDAPLQQGARLPTGGVRIQAAEPGRHKLALGSAHVEVRAIRLMAIDGSLRPVDFTSSHASFQRTPPDRVDQVDQRTDDPDALRYVVAGHAQDLPDHLRIESRGEDGSRIDELRRAKLVDVPCPAGLPSGLSCRSTWPIRVVADAVDQAHPLVMDRSIRGVLGGGLVLHAGAVAQQIRIGGPRVTKHGAIRRLRGTLRLTIPRTWAGGAPSLDSRAAVAIEMARAQFLGADALWAQCGVTFGAPGADSIRLIDPPPPFLLAVGCGLGLPSSGGQVRLLVDGKPLDMAVEPGWTPEQVARRLAREIEAKGMRVERSSNARTGPGAFPVIDLLVYRHGDTPARLSATGTDRVSNDPTMPVCVGRVDLAQGLRHFLDVDSMAGTLEERTLLKWLDDRDPGTLDAVFIPSFGGGSGRIGESFIGNDRSSLRNLVLVDRAGVSASKASHTLAHELGHVLLDVPGHPDDYGLDQPTLLMDADAAIASAFGPRRLLVSDCERMWRQSGPGASVVLLRPWPFRALSK